MKCLIRLQPYDTLKFNNSILITTISVRTYITNYMSLHVKTTRKLFFHESQDTSHIHEMTNI